MLLEIKGKLVEIHETQQVSEKFKKRDFVLDIQNGQFSDLVIMQTIQDKTSLLDGRRVGDEVTVAFNLRGHSKESEGTRKYYTNLQAWRIDAVK